MRHASSLSAVVALVAGVALYACGENTPCDDALDKLVNECGMGAGAELGPLGECKDLTKCLAKCVNKADCEDIKDEKADKYDECQNECYTATYD